MHNSLLLFFILMYFILLISINSINYNNNNIYLTAIGLSPGGSGRVFNQFLKTS